ncbi:hypothetical protein [Vibrio astriarenae]|uniref:hypothetical protein n=1 Tax=Vibrio astriarenae TaxID=1481923 RepID=UPI0037352EFA
MNKLLVVCALCLVLLGCVTSDQSLKDSGYNAAYIQGFHDGRHSGMSEEGNDFETYIKDEARYLADKDYQAGWLAGEAEGKELQSQASAIGKGLATSYPSQSHDDDFDQVAEDVVKGMDTSGLKNLE